MKWRQFGVEVTNKQRTVMHCSFIFSVSRKDRSRRCFDDVHYSLSRVVTGMTADVHRWLPVVSCSIPPCALLLKLNLHKLDIVRCYKWVTFNGDCGCGCHSWFNRKRPIHTAAAVAMISTVDVIFCSELCWRW